MEEFSGIKELECEARPAENVIRKTKRKLTFLGVIAFGLSYLTTIAYTILAVRFYLTL